MRGRDHERNRLAKPSESQKVTYIHNPYLTACTLDYCKKAVAHWHCGYNSSPSIIIFLSVIDFGILCLHQLFRSCWLLGLQSFRKEDLPKYQVRLIICTKIFEGCFLMLIGRFELIGSIFFYSEPNILQKYNPRPSRMHTSVPIWKSPFINTFFPWAVEESLFTSIRILRLFVSLKVSMMLLDLSVM